MRQTMAWPALGLVLGLCILSGRTAAEEQLVSTVKPFTGQPSLDTTMVRFRFDGKAASIPRNYLETVTTSNGGIFLRAIATYPGLSGATTSTVDCFHQANWTRCPAIIRIHKIDADGSMEQRIGSIRRSAAEQGIELRSGRVTEFIGRGGGLMPARNLAHISEDSGENFVIECGIPDPVSAHLTKPAEPFCRVYFDPRPGTRFFYEYSESLVADGLRIHQGVTGLVRRWLADP